MDRQLTRMIKVHQSTKHYYAEKNTDSTVKEVFHRKAYSMPVLSSEAAKFLRGGSAV